MRGLGLLAPMVPTATPVKVTRALVPERTLLEVLGLNDGAGLLALARAIRATPEGRWRSTVFRVVDAGSRVEVTACGRAAMAMHFRENDLGTIAHELAHRRVAPGSVMLLVEGEAGLCIQTFRAERFLHIVAKGTR